jgi:hypothetical protein
MITQNYPSGFMGQTQSSIPITEVNEIKEEVSSNSKIGEKVVTKDMKKSEISRVKKQLQKEGLDIDKRSGKVVPKGYYYTNTEQLRKSKPKYSAELVQTSTGPEIITYGKVPSALIERRVSQLESNQQSQSARDVVYSSEGIPSSKPYDLQTEAERKRTAEVSSKMFSTPEGVKYYGGQNGSVYSRSDNGVNPYDSITSVGSKESVSKTIPQNTVKSSVEVFGKPTFYDRLIRKKEELKQDGGKGSEIKQFALGVVSVPVLIVTQPKQFVSGIFQSVTKPRETALAFGEGLKSDTLFTIGEQVGGYYTFKGIGKGYEGVKVSSPKFTSESVLTGTIKEAPSTVSSSTRAQIYLKGVGISERTVDVGTSKIPYASYSPKEYVKVAEQVSPTKETTYSLLRLEIPEPRQVRTIETPVYKGSRYEIVEGRAVPTQLSEKPVYIKTTEVFKGESGREATITQRGLTFEPTGKIPLVEVSRFPYESQQVTIYPKLAKLREGELALVSDINKPSKLVKEFTVETTTRDYPSLAKAKAESDVRSAQQPLTFKNIDVQVGEATLSYGKIPSSNVFEKIVPTEKGLTAFEYKVSERVPSIKSFEPLKVKSIEGVEGELVKVTGFNIEPSKVSKQTSSFRTVKSNVEEYKLSKGESVSREGEILKTKEPEAITYDEVVAKPFESKTEMFLDVYGKNKTTVPKSQATLEGVSERIGASDININLPKQEYFTEAKKTSILYSQRREDILFTPSLKTSMTTINLLQPLERTSNKTGLESKESLSLIPTTEIKQSLEQKQVQEQKQQLEQKQILETKYSTTRDTFRTTKPLEPIKSTEYIPSFIPKAKDKKKGSKASLFVRKKGKFELKGSSEDIQSLFKRGKDIIEQTASASFKVVGESGKAILPSILPSKFTTSKKDKGILVQRREFRISSAGEKREIPGKALQMRRLI